VSNTQTFILKVNPKNGTVVVPKKARQLIGSSTLFLSITDGQIKLTIPKYSLEEVLTNPPKKNGDFNTSNKQDLNKIIQEVAVKRYLKSQ
jgi:bifunctional DNA-binding transcriptional regulator/antitoxin component of YhaV-PrlF toxin-antitoxin module